jgi:hypothetical protein
MSSQIAFTKEKLCGRHVYRSTGDRSTCYTSIGHSKSSLNFRIIYFKVTLKPKTYSEKNYG